MGTSVTKSHACAKEDANRGGGWIRIAQALLAIALIVLGAAQISAQSEPAITRDNFDEPSHAVTSEIDDLQYISRRGDGFKQGRTGFTLGQGNRAGNSEENE